MFPFDVIEVDTPSIFELARACLGVGPEVPPTLEPVFVQPVYPRWSIFGPA